MLNSNTKEADAFWGSALREALLNFTLAAIALTFVFINAIFLLYPDLERFANRNSQTVIVNADELMPFSLGEGHKDASKFFITDFNKDEAVLVLQKSFKAEDFPYIKVNLNGLTRFTTVKLLWQKSVSSEIYSQEITRNGDGLNQVSLALAGEDYSGSITSIALLFYDRSALGFKNNDNVDIVINNIELRSFSIWRVIEQIFYDWSTPPLWEASSINSVTGASQPQLLKPNLAVNLIMVSGFVLALLRRKVYPRPKKIATRAPLFAVALSLCLFGWVFNESLRWSWRVEQIIDGRERYSNIKLAQRIKNNDVRCAMYPSDCASFLYPYF